MQIFLSVIAALTIRDTLVWAWKRETHKRRTERNLEGLRRFRAAAIELQRRAA